MLYIFYLGCTFIWNFAFCKHLYREYHYLGALYLNVNDKNLCKKRIATALKTRINLIKKGENKNIFASYPLRVLFMYVRNGTFKRSLFLQKPVLKDYLFEGYTEEDYINDKKQNNIKNK